MRNMKNIGGDIILKKSLVSIVLFVFIIWVVVSVYFFTQHTVMVNEYDINKKINVDGGFIKLEKISIKNSEKKQILKANWLMDLALRFPMSEHNKLYDIGYFYTKPYNFDLDYNILTIRATFVTNDDAKELLSKLHDNITIEVLKEKMPFKIYDSSYRFSGDYVEYEARFKFLNNQYNLDKNSNINIMIKDKKNVKFYSFEIKPDWQTKFYNFFNRERSLRIGRIEF